MKRRALLALAAVAASACGYRFTAGPAPLPEGIRSAFVPVFSNRTAEPNAELAFTEAMREELARDGSLGGPNSEARLQGEVVGLLNTTGLALSNVQGTPPVYRLIATVRLRLLKGSKLVAQVDVSDNEDYLSAAGDVLLTESNRRAALQRLARSLMAQGHQRLASGF